MRIFYIFSVTTLHVFSILGSRLKTIVTYVPSHHPLNARMHTLKAWSRQRSRWMGYLQSADVCGKLQIAHFTSTIVLSFCFLGSHSHFGSCQVSLSLASPVSISFDFNLKVPQLSYTRGAFIPLLFDSSAKMRESLDLLTNHTRQYVCVSGTVEYFEDTLLKGLIQWKWPYSHRLHRICASQAEKGRQQYSSSLVNRN